jgi:hypothetical protein
VLDWATCLWLVISAVETRIRTRAITDLQDDATGLTRRTKWFVAWTVCSALTVWLGLSVAEGLAAERCTTDGLAWDWKAWSCTQPRGTIILPSSLRRADTPGKKMITG